MPVMKDKIFAVIDTNVIVSALLSSNLESNPVKVFRAIVQERIVPLYNDEILEEYRCVLSRPKFHLDRSLIDTVIKAIVTDGLNIDRTPAANIDFPDPKDIVFYEVALSVEDSSCHWQYKAFPCKTIHCHPCRNDPHLGKLEFVYGSETLFLANPHFTPVGKPPPPCPLSPVSIVVLTKLSVASSCKPRCKPKSGINRKSMLI